MAEASAKRVTGDEPQGTMGRGPSRLPLRAYFHQKRDVWVRGRSQATNLEFNTETYKIDRNPQNHESQTMTF